MQRRRGPLFVRRMRALRTVASPNPERRIRPSAAVDVTRLFIEEYAHAAPLDPGALLGFWERCGVNQTGVALCRPGLHAAERLVIGDAPPDPDDWLTPAADEAATAQHAAPAEPSRTKARRRREL